MKQVRLKLVIIITLAVVTIALFWRVGSYGYINFDDGDYITKNPHVRSGLTTENIGWAFGAFHSSNWHPLTWMSHMLDVQWFGLKAGPAHVVNLLLHTANVLLVFGVFLTTSGRLWQSAFIAAIFAWHPLHVESVAWISERKDVLSAFFWLLTMMAYVRHARAPGWRTYALVMLCFILGILSKPMVVTLPAVLLLLDYWPLQRAPRDFSAWRGWWPLVREKIPLLIVSLISCVVTLAAQRASGALVSLAEVPLSVRLGNSLLGYIGYIGKTLCPIQLAVFYPLHLPLPLWQIIGAACLLGLTSIMAIWRAKQHPYFFTGWFWFVITLLPVIGLVQVGDQAMADRYMYLPLLGLLIVVTWGVPQVLDSFRTGEKAGRHDLAVIASVTLSVAALLSFRQLAYWKDSLTLFEHALAVTKDNWFAHGNVATSYANKGQPGEAISHYRELLKLRPNELEAMNNLAWLLASARDETHRNGMEALILAERVMARNPSPNSMDTWALALAETHSYDEAVQVAERARDGARIQGNEALANRIEGRIALYRQRIPYRQ